MEIKCKECEKMILYVREPISVFSYESGPKKRTKTVYLKCDNGHVNPYNIEE